MARQLLTFRLTETGVEKIDEVTRKLTVQRDGRPVTRTDVLRAALRVAFSDPDALERMVLRIKADEEGRL